MTLIEQKALAHQRSRHSFVIGLNKSLLFRPIPKPLHQIVVFGHGVSPSLCLEHSASRGRLQGEN
jgi:hypothetical protein